MLRSRALARRIERIGAAKGTAVGPLDRGLVLFADDHVVFRGEIGTDGRSRITTGAT